MAGALTAPAPESTRRARYARPAGHYVDWRRRPARRPARRRFAHHPEMRRMDYGENSERETGREIERNGAPPSQPALPLPPLLTADAPGGVAAPGCRRWRQRLLH